MGSIKADRALVADNDTDQSRREALKKFARYAAVAPTAMVLLAPSVGHAGRRGGGRRGGRGDDGHN
jgi:hypothetical protein